MDSAARVSTDTPTIDVLLPTRGRPVGVVRAVRSLLETNPTGVRVLVGTDADDIDSAAAIASAGFDPEVVQFLQAEREDTLGAKLNRLYRGSSADILVYFADDLAIQTPDWDAVVREWVALYTDGLGVWSLTVAELGQHRFTHLPVLTRRTCETLGYFAPEVFPFWWWDTWLDEIGTIAMRKLVIPAKVASQHGPEAWRGKVTGLRDVAFWARTFEALRGQRVHDAGRLIKATGCAGTMNMAQQQLVLTAAILAANNANLTDPVEAAIFDTDWTDGDGIDEARYQRVKGRALLGAPESAAA